jgi:hypothetical protein
MSDAEKVAERLEKREFPPGSSMFGEYDFLVRLCKEAATLTRRLQAENEALSVKQAKLAALVQKAYHEGFGEGIKEHTTHRGGKGWHESRARAAVEEVSL